MIFSLSFAIRFSLLTDHELKFAKLQFFSKMDITMTTINKIRCVTKINLTLKAILEKHAAFTLTENVFVSFIEDSTALYRF